MNGSQSISTAPEDLSSEVGGDTTGQAPESHARRRIVYTAGVLESANPDEQGGSGRVNALSLTSNIAQETEYAECDSTHRTELQQVDAPKASFSKKRTSSKSSSAPKSSPDTDPPPAKKLHHRHRPPRELHSSRSPRRSTKELSTQGPLFFSDQTQPRPPLPYRMSSSEAGAKMLGKGAKEETGGVRTLKLARGPASASGPSRPGNQRTPSGSGRSHFGLPKTPGSPGIGGRSSGITSLKEGGVFELLNQDDRPTFILDMTEQKNFEPGPLRVTYANASLRAVPGVLDTISGATGLESPNLAVNPVFTDFKTWCISYVKDHEPLDVTLPAFTYAGATWTSSTLRKRFRVYRGIPISPKTNLSSSNPPSVGVPSPLYQSKENEAPRETRSFEAAIEEEPDDYFGRAGNTIATMNAGDSINDDDAEITRGLRISKLTQPLDPPSPLPSTSGLRHAPLADVSVNQSLTASPTSYKGAEPCSIFPSLEQRFFDWTRLADSPTLPRHVQFAKSIDWGSTSLGPIEGWSSELRSMCNLIMASPHPAAMYWGEDYIAIYNEAYIYLAGQKHPKLMGQSYYVAWAEIWDSVKDVFDMATRTGESTMKEDDCLFIQRNTTDGRLEEAWFDWSIIPLVGGDGSVVGLYNPAFEKTKRKVGERRMGTLSTIGEKTSTAKDLKTFWAAVISGLESNVYDAPFVLLYSVSDDVDSDSQSSMHGNLPPLKHAVLEGSIGVPAGHPAAALQIDLRDESDHFAQVFRDAAIGNRPVVLSAERGTLDPDLLEGIEMRGHPEPCTSAICCPVQSTRNETLGYLIMGVNPRRPYDDDYSTFIQMLSRQISTAIASVVLFEEEIRAGIRAKRRADMARNELSERLAVQTQAAVETERKFTQMAKFAPVGIFIADSNGVITFRNEKWFEILQASNDHDAPYHWMEAIKDEDKVRVERLWSNLVLHGVPMNTEVRFKSSWVDQNGNKGDTWVLASGYPEKDEEGNVKVIFGSITDISQQKWAEHFEKRRMEEAVELKRQQENFIDMTSHEMRNPLSAILQCADEISTSLIDLKETENSQGLTYTIPETLIDSAGTIALCAQHQKRIVDDILTLSKLDSALLLVTPDDQIPQNVVQRALKMFEGEVQNAGIDLNFRIDDSVKDLGIEWVRLDPSRLLQVLINLTTNAIKFTTTQAKRSINVTLGASLEPPSKDGPISYFPTRLERKDLTEKVEWGGGEKIFIHFAVQDTGRGLSEDEQKLLFLRFSQTSPRTHVQYGGSGLGLFISRELVELQGGEIGVTSKAGEGSTFAFYIKARRSSAPATGADHLVAGAGARKASSGLSAPHAPFIAQTQPRDLSQTPQKSKLPKPDLKDALKILVVEDNLVNQSVLARQLRNLGVIVYVANHGGECLDLLKESTFWKGTNGSPHQEGKPERIQIDVILMDQEMPVMDGLTCTRAIREMEEQGLVNGHVPIIAVTANARSEQIDTARRIGMDDVVSKPFRIPDLIPKVEELIVKFPSPVYSRQ